MSKKHILTDEELDIIYRDRRLSRKIDPDLLMERVMKDGRSPEQIDKAANVHKGTTRWLMASQWNEASVWIIERIRLALRPQIRARYLYMKPNDAGDYSFLTDNQKREERIYDAIYDLCEQYSLTEVKEAIWEIDTRYTGYMEEVGFNIKDIFEEESKGVPEIDYNGQIKEEIA